LKYISKVLDAMASSIGAPPRKLSTLQNTFVPLIVGYNEGNKLEWKQVKLLDVSINNHALTIF
jgi:hypothetical protein